MMTYARQIAPENQYVDLDELFDTENRIAVTGNCYMNEYFSESAEKAFKQLDGYVQKYANPDETVAELKEKTGLDWNYQVIRGTCQSDWNYLYYIDWETTEEEREIIESKYFNTGTEYIIHIHDTPPESPEAVDGFSLYVPETSRTPTDPKQALAAYTGTNPDELTVFLFDGWTRTARYIKC